MVVNPNLQLANSNGVVPTVYLTKLYRVSFGTLFHAVDSFCNVLSDNRLKS